MPFLCTKRLYMEHPKPHPWNAVCHCAMMAPGVDLVGWGSSKGVTASQSLASEVEKSGPGVQGHSQLHRPTWATGNESKVVWEQRSISVTHIAHSKPAHRHFNSARPRALTI